MRTHPPVGEQSCGKAALHGDDGLAGVERGEVLDEAQREYQEGRRHHQLRNRHLHRRGQQRRGDAHPRNRALQRAVPPVEEWPWMMTEGIVSLKDGCPSKSSHTGDGKTISCEDSHPAQAHSF